MKYRSDIDGLRALAVLPVLFFHAGMEQFSGGFVGVDVFFVISGFLITTIIAQEIRAGSFSLGRFYERRLRRIFPALIVVCLFTIPFAWFWMGPREFGSYAQSPFSAVVSLSNFLFWRETDYFAPAAELKPLLHTWSLAVEEQFYLVLPLMLMIVGVAARGRLLLAVLALASFAATFWFAAADPAANFYLLPTRFWELAAGSLMAFAAPRLLRLPRWSAEAISMAGLLLIVTAIFTLDGLRQYPGPATLIPVAGTAMLLGSAANTWAGRLLSMPPLVGIGLISYSAYLWHQPLFAFARIRLIDEVPGWLYALLIGVTLLLAYASWRWIEKPFRNFRALPTRAALGAVACGAAVLIAFGLFTHQIEDLLGRGSDRGQAEALQHRLRPNRGLSRACNGELPLPQACITDEAPEIVVWGDSYAMHLVPAILASNETAAIAQFTKTVCGPVNGVAPVRPPTYPVEWAKECNRFNQAARDFIETTPSVRFVVLSSSFDSYLSRHSMVLRDGEVVPSSPEAVLDDLRRTAQWLQRRGKIPIIVGPPPRDGRDIGNCLIRATWFGLDTSRCDIDPAKLKPVDEAASGLLERLAEDHRVIDLADLLCDTTRCAAAAGDVFIYRDGGHLTYEGARYIGEVHDLHGLIVSPHPPDGANAGQTEDRQTLTTPKG